MNFWIKFKENRRGYFSFIILIFLFFLTLFAEVISNEKPLFVRFEQHYYFPVIFDVLEKDVGGDFESLADFRDPFLQEKIKQNGFIIWAPIKFSYDTINYNLQIPAPSKPSFENLLGTDDQGRDVLSRVIYGIRISLIFGFILAFFSASIGVFLGAIQGYFGGVIDLFLQRFIEVWSSMPVLFLLIILSSIIEPSFIILLFFSPLLFSMIGINNLTVF